MIFKVDVNASSGGNAIHHVISPWTQVGTGNQPVLVPYPDLQLSVGDTISFEWQGYHNVGRLSSNPPPSPPPASATYCPGGSNFVPGTFNQTLAPPVRGGTFSLPLTEPGSFWLYCQVCMCVGRVWLPSCCLRPHSYPA